MRMNKVLAVVLVTLVALTVLPVQAASARAMFTDCEAELFLVAFEEGTVTPSVPIRTSDGASSNLSRSRTTPSAPGGSPWWPTTTWMPMGMGPSGAPSAGRRCRTHPTLEALR